MVAARRAAALAFVATAVAIAACGSTAGHARLVPGRSGVDVVPPVRLTVRRLDGSSLEIPSLRGHPVLLFVFLTYDGMSQASLDLLRRFVREHPEVRVVGVAAQPHARALLEAWAASLEPPFEVTHDEGGTVAAGTSDLGRIDAVPAFFALDARGRLVGRHVGLPTMATLRALWAAP
ncbi:MAG: TlpA family protein disulfide reductase [Myxococcota bacterium]|nr:TlpA family protein disulfide reductase [Myxococcota bacterium]MDW8361446.1 TlpA disulfide reductase family protein [Myxococcales bacterium]